MGRVEKADDPLGQGRNKGERSSGERRRKRAKEVLEVRGVKCCLDVKEAEVRGRMVLVWGCTSWPLVIESTDFGIRSGFRL